MVLYVVDASAPQKLGQAKKELHKLLESAAELMPFELFSEQSPLLSALRLAASSDLSCATDLRNTLVRYVAWDTKVVLNAPSLSLPPLSLADATVA